MTIKIENITFYNDEGCTTFEYTQNGIAKTAYLQLPHTPDSLHEINNKTSDGWDIDNENCEENIVYKILVEHYENSFKNNRFAPIASACNVSVILDVKEIVYKNITIYVAIDDDRKTHLLVQNRYSDYYNEDLFDLLNRNKQIELFGEVINEKALLKD